MKKVLLIPMLLLFVFSAQAQSQTKTLRDTIQVLRHPFGWHYKQYGETLTPRTLMLATQSNPDAYKLMRKAVHQNNIATAAIFISAAMIVGGTVAYAAAGKDINLPLTGAGIGVAIISIPISKASSRNTDEAVKIYNDNLRAMH